jgi:hypothetical protein
LAKLQQELISRFIRLLFTTNTRAMFVHFMTRDGRIEMIAVATYFFIEARMGELPINQSMND